VLVLALLIILSLFYFKLFYILF